MEKEEKKELRLVNKGDMISKRRTKQAMLPITAISEKKEKKDRELRRFAEIVINERIKFCREYKKDENLEKCVCDAITRWVRLFKDRPMEGSRELGRLRVIMVEKVFEEMRTNGKIK